MTRAVLSIGSNLGDRLAHLQSVLDALGPAVLAVSGVYETAPWGGVDQQDFLNAIVLVEDSIESAEWLRRAQEIEAAAERVRDVRWGPRTLDVDIVDVAGASSDDPDLTLPHPRAGERAFVLVPWLEVDAEARLRGVPVVDVLAALPESERVGVRRTDHELRRAG